MRKIFAIYALQTYLWLAAAKRDALTLELDENSALQSHSETIENHQHFKAAADQFRLRLLKKSASQTTDMAIVTHVCDASWAPGALALAASLKRAGTKYDLVLLITSAFSDRYQRLFAHVFDKVYVEEPLKEHPSIVRTGADCVTLQLRAWQLPYQKVLYMDSDMIALKSHDAVLEDSVELSARKDVGLETQFNSGMIVLEPAESKFEQLRQMLAGMPSATMVRSSMVQNKTQGVFLGGSQYFLNKAFPSCSEPSEREDIVGCWKGDFSDEYNKYTRLVQRIDIDTKKYASLHFSGDWNLARKPWMSGCLEDSDSVTHSRDGGLRQQLLGLWMDVFHSLSVPEDLEDLMRTDCEAESVFREADR